MADIAAHAAPAADIARGNWIRALGRFLMGWIGGLLTTVVVGTVLQTQSVLGSLDAVGADVTLGERLSMTVYDLTHLGFVYGLFIALATVVAYAAGVGVYRLAGFGRPVVFAVAGAVAMAVMLVLMKKAMFGVQLIAGARMLPGFLGQCVAGALGGLVFASLSARRGR